MDAATNLVTFRIVWCLRQMAKERTDPEMKPGLLKNKVYKTPFFVESISTSTEVRSPFLFERVFRTPRYLCVSHGLTASAKPQRKKRAVTSGQNGNPQST
jgi:hypothetical protein